MCVPLRALKMLSVEMIWITLLLVMNLWKDVHASGAADINRLHTRLFDREYNRIVRPSLDYSQPIKVKTRLSVTSVQSLDIKHQVLLFRGVLHFSWTDELLSWEPMEFGNISSIVVPQIMIWRPDIVIVNALESQHSGLIIKKDCVLASNKGNSRTRLTDHLYLWDDGASLVVLQHNGFVRWEPIFNIGVSCKVDISKYPFDHHICSLSISSWMNDVNSVNLTFDDPAIGLENMISNGEFQVRAHGVDSKLYPSYDLLYIQCCFYLELSRRSAYVTMTLLMPVSLVTVLGGVSFLMPPGEPERLTISISVMLSFTVFLGIIDGGLPETSENISLLVVYVVALLLLTFIVVVGNSAVYIVHRHENQRTQEVKPLPSNRHENRNHILTRHDLPELMSKIELSRKSHSEGTVGGHHNVENRNSSDFSDTEASEIMAKSSTNIESVSEKLNRRFIILVSISFILIVTVTFYLMLS